jgi:hypothetical protein
MRRTPVCLARHHLRGQATRMRHGRLPSVNWYEHGQGTDRSLGSGRSGAWTGTRRVPGQGIGMSLDRGQAGVWVRDRQDARQSTVWLGIIHAFKPTVCAMSGSRQSTGMSLGRGQEGVRVGDWSESWQGMVMSLDSQGSGSASSTRSSLQYALLSAPVSQLVGVWTGDGQEPGQGTGRRMDMGQAGALAGVGLESGQGMGRSLGN